MYHIGANEYLLAGCVWRTLSCFLNSTVTSRRDCIPRRVINLFDISALLFFIPGALFSGQWFRCVKLCQKDWRGMNLSYCEFSLVEELLIHN